MAAKDDECQQCEVLRQALRDLIHTLPDTRAMLIARESAIAALVKLSDPT